MEVKHELKAFHYFVFLIFTSKNVGGRKVILTQEINMCSKNIKVMGLLLRDEKHYPQFYLRKYVKEKQFRTTN